MSRDIEDCTPAMHSAWVQAKAQWKQTYPDLPQPFLTCTYRTMEEQAKLYAQGRTTKGTRVTNAKPGQSPHNYFPSPAFDIAFVTLSKKLDWSMHLFKKFADLIKPFGVDWGGDWKSFKDNPHFQEKGWSLKAQKKQ